MKIWVLGVVFLLSSPAWALRLTYVGETSIPHGMKFEKTVIGGLSGIVWQGNSLFALSDDKGSVSEMRFYEFELKVDKNKVSLKPKNVRLIKGLPLVDGKPANLDPEGLALLPDGSFLISSEGNNNRKPRVMSRLLQVSADGKWQSDLAVPEKFLPELTGKQHKGTQNNASFEGLTLSPSGQEIFVGTESSLVQDSVPDEEEKGSWIRLIKYQKNEKSAFVPSAEYAYRLEPLQSDQASKEVFRGVSEILALSDTKIIVLERGVRISTKSIAMTSALYLVDLSKASDVKSFEKLSAVKFTGAAKTKLLDFETDLKDKRANKAVQNFEALSWGPKLADGKRTLLVMSDNNFKKNEITELVVFSVEEE